MKRVIWLCLSIIVLLALLPSCGRKQDQQGQNKSTTLMIYMVGSDLEPKAGAASADIEEIATSGIDLSRNKVIVCAGGSPHWHNEQVNKDQINILALQEQGFTSVSTMESASMGTAEQLSSFLNYCYENYSSDEYALILWDHGNGPVMGYGKDILYGNDALLLSEMAQAMESSVFSEENKLAWVGFDACLMASAELSCLLSDYTNYLIASQEIEPAFGWDYSFLAQLGSVDTLQLLKKITDDYMAACDAYYKERNYDHYDVTLSVVDLSYASELENAINSLFSTASGEVSHYYDLLAMNRVQSRALGRATTGSEYDLVDLKDMTVQLSAQYPELTKKLLDVIDRMVVVNATSIESCCGMSLYYPFYNKYYYEKDWKKVYTELDIFPDYTQSGVYCTELLPITVENVEEPEEKLPVTKSEWKQGEDRVLLKEQDGLKVYLTTRDTQSNGTRYFIEAENANEYAVKIQLYNTVANGTLLTENANIFTVNSYDFMYEELRFGISEETGDLKNLTSLSFEVQATNDRSGSIVWPKQLLQVDMSFAPIIDFLSQYKHCLDYDSSYLGAKAGKQVVYESDSLRLTLMGVGGSSKATYSKDTFWLYAENLSEKELNLGIFGFVVNGYFISTNSEEALPGGMQTYLDVWLGGDSWKALAFDQINSLSLLAAASEIDLWWMNKTECLWCPVELSQTGTSQTAKAGKVLWEENHVRVSVYKENAKNGEWQLLVENNSDKDICIEAVDELFDDTVPNQLYSYSLSEEQAKNYQSAVCYLLKRDGENVYRVQYNNCGVTFSDGKLNTNYDGMAVEISVPTGEHCYPVMDLNGSDNSKGYIGTVVLTDKQDNMAGWRYLLKIGEENKPELTAIRLREEGTDEDLLSGKYNDLPDFESYIGAFITDGTYYQPTYDDRKNPLPISQWTANDAFTGYDIDLANKVEMNYVPLVGGDYYLLYEITDTQGNTYCSDFIPYKTEPAPVESKSEPDVAVKWTKGERQQLLLENNGVEVYLSVEKDVLGNSTYALKVKNSTQNAVSCRTENGLVNGIVPCTTGLSLTVEPGKFVADSIGFSFGVADGSDELEKTC